MHKTKQKNPWIDYKALKAQVSVLQVLETYGIELNTTNGDQFTGCCPLPGHGGDRSNQQAFSVSIEKNCWRCHSHCGSGNVIELYCLLSDRDSNDKQQFREAAVEMTERFSDASEMPPKQEKIPSKPKPDRDEEPPYNEPLSFQLQLKSDHPFLVDEKGFSPEIIEEFGLGWCSKGMQAGRVVVPIHDESGQLIAYAGRGLKENDIAKRGRWLLPKGFAKRIVLYNEHRVPEQIRAYPDAPLVVVEGFWSAIRLHSAGYPAVSLMGAEMSDAQLERITRLADHVFLMMDNDDTGRGAIPKITAGLARHVSVNLVNYPDGDDRTQPEDFTNEELQKLIPS